MNPSQLTVLPNGIRVVSLEIPSVESVAVAVWADVGSRHESPEINGISHFVEHLLFKGTPRRSAKKISMEVEGVGGEINAHTTWERTCYHAIAPRHRFANITRVLLDLFANPKLAPRDIDLERSVIEEEIRMYRDEPDEHVHDLLNAIFWPNHPLGRPITGTSETLKTLRRPQLLAFRKSYYHSANTLVSAAGAVRHSELVRLVEKQLDSLPSGSPCPPTPAPKFSSKPEILFEERPISQAHLSLGLPGISLFSKQIYAATLLNVMLGGSASSRLFQDLRERKGLCYSVATYLQSLSDTGMFNLSVSLDPSNVEKCLRSCRKHFRNFTESLCSAKELERAKEYVIGSSRISLERTAVQNKRIATSILSHGREIPPDEVFQNLQKVTPEQIRSVAKKLLRPQQAKLAVVAPFVPLDSLPGILTDKTA